MNAPMTACRGCGRQTFDWTYAIFQTHGGTSTCKDCAHALIRARKELIVRHHDEYDLLVAMYRARRTPLGENLR